MRMSLYNKTLWTQWSPSKSRRSWVNLQMKRVLLWKVFLTSRKMNSSNRLIHLRYFQVTMRNLLSLTLAIKTYSIFHKTTKRQTKINREAWYWSLSLIWETLSRYQASPPLYLQQARVYLTPQILELPMQNRRNAIKLMKKQKIVSSQMLKNRLNQILNSKKSSRDK